MKLLDAIVGWASAFRHRNGDPKGVDEKRRRWSSLAERHALAFHPGPHRGYVQGDRVEGHIDGRHVRVQRDADYHLQKLVVTLSIECNVGSPGASLSKRELVDWYEARAIAPLDQELAPWVLGQRAGVGAVLDRDAGRLLYRQLYDIEEPTLELLLDKLPRWAHRLEQASRV